MQSWEPRQPAFKISQKWEFSDICFLRLASNELEASVVSVMAEALILKLLGRVCQVNTSYSSQQGVSAMVGTFVVSPLCKLHGHRDLA